MEVNSHWTRGLRLSPLGGFIILVFVVAVFLLFIPMASCPMCLGSGSVNPDVNREWMRKRHLVLTGPIFENLGKATCARCRGSGRVTILGACTQ